MSRNTIAIERRSDNNRRDLARDDNPQNPDQENAKTTWQIWNVMSFLIAL